MTTCFDRARFSNSATRACSASDNRSELRLLRCDIAHEEGFSFVNPLSVRKQIEGQITWFWNDTMLQECNVTEGRIAENNFDKFPLSRIK